MKKTVFLLSLLFSLALFSQQDSINPDKHPIIKLLLGDTSNKNPGIISFNISQTALSDWQGGGENNFTIISLVKYDPVYKKKRYELTNKIDAQYGLVSTGYSVYRKNIDRLFLLTKSDIRAFGENWWYSLQADFRSQLSPGYVYRNDSIVGRATSDFLSPCYIQLALGLDFKLKDYLSITIAPLAGKVTHVNRQHLADEGLFGVTGAVKDSAGNVVTPGKRTRYEFGGRVVLKFKKDVSKSINVDSYVDLFSNYMNNPQNIDVVVNNTLTFRITKYFSASIISQLVYDDDIIVKRDWNRDGAYDHTNDINGPRLQALTTVAIGFSAKFR